VGQRTLHASTVDLDLRGTDKRQKKRTKSNYKNMGGGGGEETVYVAAKQKGANAGTTVQ